MTEAEIKRAEKDAERDAKELGLLLLLAFKSRDGSIVKSVRFDIDKGKFYVNDRAVASRTIISFLERINDKMSRRLVKITSDLEAGRITVDEWKRSFDRTIKSSHILAGAFAVGGIVLASRNTFVNTQIDLQLEFADAFSEEIRKNKAGSFAKIRARAKGYTRAAQQTFVNLELELVKQSGFRKEAFNILRSNEPCNPKNGIISCPQLTAKAWMPVDEMVRIGDRACGIYCRCYIAYR